jgi:hypothetical protein
MSKTLAYLHSRSIRFQLTSLMDLLLIIVFAQYLEFHRSSAAARAKTEQEISEARQSLEVQLGRKTQELDQVRNELVLDNRQLRQQKDTAVAMTEEAQRRQTLTEELLRKLLQVDAELIDAELSPPESMDALRDTEATAEAIRNTDGANLLRFLAGYDELLKRAEVWTIHVSDRGDTEVKAGGHGGKSTSFRLEEVSQAARTEEFVQQMRAAYSQFPQPKGLVVILVSFSPRAIAGNYQPVLDGMPLVIEWLGEDSGGRTRFEYSVIGAITDPHRDLPVDDGTQ